MINFCVSRVPGCCDLLAGDTDDITIDGCKVADTISNNLIVNNQMAASAGRALLDSEGYDWKIIQVSTSLYEGCEPKCIVENTDKRNGKYRGKVSKFSIRIERQSETSFSARSVFEIKRPII